MVKKTTIKAIEIIKRFSLYIEKHNLLIKYGERRRGVFRVLLGWTFVGFGAVSFQYALEKTGIPGPVALFFQSLFTLAFPIIKCIFDEGYASLKIVQKVTITPQHLSVAERRWSIFIRCSLGILAWIFFEYSKEFSSLVDNSAIFGADAVVVALFMSIVLKQRIGIRWLWIGIAMLGVFTIIYTDFGSFNWINLDKGIFGAFFGISSVILLAIVLLMTSYMVHHDKPITIAFYQCVASVIYSSLFLVGSLIYLSHINDTVEIKKYFDFLSINTLKSYPIIFLCLGGFLYGWALLLFFQSLYYTELIIVATLGYFLSPIISVFEWFFFQIPMTIKDAINTSFITIGTAGLYWHEKKSKEKEKIFTITETESLQDNLYNIIDDFKEKRINKYIYLSWMYEFDKLLYSFQDMIKQSIISRITIKKSGVFFKIVNPMLEIEDDASFRSPTFDILNFGKHESEITDFIAFNLRNNCIIIDIGSGIGWHVLSLSKKLPNAKIYAFEPIQDLFKTLKRNVKLNKIENIKHFNFGISKKNGAKNYYYLKSQHEFLRNILQPTTQRCRAKTFTSVIKSLKLNKIDCIIQELNIKEEVFTLGKELLISNYKPLILFILGEYWDENMLSQFKAHTQPLIDVGYERLTIEENLEDDLHKEKCFVFYYKKIHKNIKSFKFSNNFKCNLFQ